ncbi:MAG: APC family permease [Verrucomicrobia bacterium]|nr:APC family permease [Verrucomicrobiota bacterium]
MTQKPTPQLSLFDSTCLIVGIIIGAGIYQMAPDIARGAGSAWGVLGIWVLGGLLSLCGALGYAELATAYPHEGGDYVYLGRAYGKWAGFLFGWAQMAIVRPGDIAVMAFAFATYACAVWDPLAGSAFPYGQQCYAVLATVAFTFINVVGVREGKWTQNLLTSVKALGLLAIVGAAFLAPPQPPRAETAGQLPYSLALIFVLFTYGGWNEMAYVAAEVRNPRRNIVRALVLGMGAVMGLYLAVNGAFLYALGYEGLTGSKAVAADAVSVALPRVAGGLVSALICVSALGAVNGLIFTGARISYAVGADHPLFRFVGRWHARFGTPAAALLLQGAITVTLIIVLGSFVDAVLYTAATVYSFYLGSTLAVIVLRFKEPHVERPYRMLGYPLTPLVFAGVCAFLIYSAVVYKPWIALVSCGLLALGLPLWLASNRLARHQSSPT